MENFYINIEILTEEKVFLDQLEELDNLLFRKYFGCLAAGGNKVGISLTLTLPESEDPMEAALEMVDEVLLNEIFPSLPKITDLSIDVKDEEEMNKFLEVS